MTAFSPRLARRRGERPRAPPVARRRRWAGQSRRCSDQPPVWLLAPQPACRSVWRSSWHPAILTPLAAVAAAGARLAPLDGRRAEIQAATAAAGSSPPPAAPFRARLREAFDNLEACHTATAHRKAAHRNRKAARRNKAVALGSIRRWRSIRRRHHADGTVTRRTRDDAVDGADSAASGIDHNPHEDAAEIGSAEHIGPALTQGRGQRIKPGRTNDPGDLVGRHEAGQWRRRRSGWRRLRKGWCGGQ